MPSNNPHGLPPTLCWDCAWSNGSGDCPWVDHQTPVEGWEAIPNHVAGHYGFDSFSVVKCPSFKRDSHNAGQSWQWGRPGKKTELSSGDAVKIASRIIDQAVQDWRDIKDTNNLRLDGQVVWHEEVVEFFNSSWFERLLALASDLDPDKCRDSLKIPKTE